MGLTAAIGQSRANKEITNGFVIGLYDETGLFKSIDRSQELINKVMAAKTSTEVERANKSGSQTKF